MNTTLRTKRGYMTLVCIFLFLNQSNIKAQVTIGEDREPHPGAVLELVSLSKHGLLLPHVSLTNAGTWQLDGTPVEGMTVYNEAPSTLNDLKGKGLYVWVDNKWRVAQQTTCNGTPSIGNISTDKTSCMVNEPFQAWVAPSVGATQYVWKITGAVSTAGYSNTNTISLVGMTKGTITITVKAIGVCGTTAESPAKTINIY
ncbi:MAG: hypothetical protein LBP34_04780 [Flavobacteriaceae bacterium]|jgi:hypothetical protein|nr:hypothetical protein [Flavobacteriaceae bacterium]